LKNGYEIALKPIDGRGKVALTLHAVFQRNLDFIEEKDNDDSD
jgi:hypothetical protein